jgi:hypothetical protein
MTTRLRAGQPATGVGGRRIQAHIDRLVLNGIDPADQKALTAGLKAELTRVFADKDLRAALTGSRWTPTLRLGRLETQPGAAGARALGAGVAQAIGRGIRR